MRPVFECPSWFINYVMDYYGPSGIYVNDQVQPFTPELIRVGTALRLRNHPDIHFEGDTTDRELVRDECNQLLSMPTAPVDEWVMDHRARS